MPRGASSQGPRKSAASWPRPWRILALIVLLAATHGFAQQGVPGNARQHSKISPLLQEAEDLLRQGSIDEGKRKIQEELQRNPASVDGYNLLGIVYTDQRDYPNALEAFQQALKLDPSSTRALNNLENIDTAENKL